MADRKAERIEVAYEGPRQFVTTDDDPKPIRITLTCHRGLEAGTDLRVSVRNFHAMDWQTWSMDSVEVVDGSGRIVVGHDLPRDWPEMTRGGVGPAGGGLIGRPINEVYMTTVGVTQPISPGARVVFSFRATLQCYAGVGAELMAKVREPESEAFTLIGEPISLENSPGEPTRLEVRATPTSDGDGGVRVVLFATDDYLNPVPGYEGEVALNADGPLEGLPATVDGSTLTAGRAELGVRVVSGAAAVRIDARDDERGLQAASGPVLSAPVGECRHFFGSIHFHTRLSVDGDREPRAAYDYARDYLNLDVVALADHAPIGSGWQEALAVNEEFYEPGRFVTIPAWENSTAYGHANLYLRNPDVDAGPGHWDPEANPSEHTWSDDVVMVPHHPNCGSLMLRGTHRKVLSEGTYWTRYDWTVPNRRARLVEIAQGESYEIDDADPYWRVHPGGHRAAVRDAFRIGWRLGFVTGTDNHQGYPSQRLGEYVDLTCFRAPELTREAIWQAMDQRRTYATTGAPIVADFEVCGLPSGSEGPFRGKEVTFSATLHGTAPIERVEVISDDRCVWQADPNAWDVELADEPLPPPRGEWAYYYLRMRQVDGHIAWLSPVWLDRDRA